jgi:hypothetical protein
MLDAFDKVVLKFLAVYSSDCHFTNASIYHEARWSPCQPPNPRHVELSGQRQTQVRCLSASRSSANGH